MQLELDVLHKHRRIIVITATVDDLLQVPHLLGKTGEMRAILIQVVALAHHAGEVVPPRIQCNGLRVSGSKVAIDLLIGQLHGNRL